MGWGIGGVCPPRPTRGPEDRCELSSGVHGAAPDGNATAFWRILKATERFLHLYADAWSSSHSVSCSIWGGGQLPPL